jgi:hypothetical protein
MKRFVVILADALVNDGAKAPADLPAADIVSSFDTVLNLILNGKYRE